jgi:hypothetical protein
MDKELLARLCYQFSSMAGCIKMVMPDIYHRLYDLNDTFTKDEIETIMNIAEQSEEHKRSVAMVMELLHEWTEENDG